MEKWIMAGQLLLGLSLLIILHEWGHYYPAKLFKIKVEKFYLFFDPYFSLIKKKIGETEYGIGWLPLGGYVKIAGMIDESMDKEQMKGPPQPWEFRSKPVWQRLIVMLGGVTVNLILGFIIYSMILFTWGRDIADPASYENGSQVNEILAPYGFEHGDKIIDYANQGYKNYPDLNLDIMLFDVRELKVEKANGQVNTIKLPDNITNQMLDKGVRVLFSPRSYAVIGEIQEGGAKDAGLQAKDSLVSINGNAFTYYDEYKTQLNGNEGKKVGIGFYRDGQLQNLNVQLDSTAKMGFRLAQSFGNYEKQHISFGFFESIPAGISYGWRTLRAQINGLKYIFTKSGSKQVGSFLAFANAYGGTWDWQNFWSLTALISIILAFMNVLPIPALDGGHVMFLLYEMISGKPPSQKFLEVAQTIGFFLLIGLIIFALKNDVVNYILK